MLMRLDAKGDKTIAVLYDKEMLLIAARQDIEVR